MPLHELADLVLWLPPGCALWRDMGGPLSITREQDALRWLTYVERVAVWQHTEDGKHGRKQPEPPKPIPWAYETAAKNTIAGKKTDAWLRRQELRGARGG